MCLAIPGKVIQISGREALIEYPGENRRVLVGEDGVKVGDYVMVQMGIIVKILNAKEAKITMEAWEQKR